MDNMFPTKTGVFGIFLLFCCSSEGAIELMNRTSVALAKETVSWHIVVDVPANSSASVQCCVNHQEVWNYNVIGHHHHGIQKVQLLANIIMNDSLDSEEFYFQYMNERVYGVVLVLDEVFLPEISVESFIIVLLALVVLLLLFSGTGSLYIFKFYKEYRPAEVEGDDTKKQIKKEKAVKEETVTSESVYTALDVRQVSVYDVLNVDEVRSTSRNSQIQANTSTMEEGIFESVYENLETV